MLDQSQYIVNEKFNSLSSMGKESKAGTQFYASVGLKAVTVHLPPDVHKKLLKIAEKDDRSLQKTIRRILVEYVRSTRDK